MTPLVLFVFNRPDTTRRILQAIHQQTQKPDKLIIFSDGPRNADDHAGVNTVRNMIRAIRGIELDIRERQNNYGCARNIIEGLSEVLSKYREAVILEDDVLPAPTFYESLCVLLQHYADQPKVFSVGGFPSIMRNDLSDYPFDVILSPRFSCWGWGTWADRWAVVRDKLVHFQNPFGTPDNVPTIAGDDLGDGAAAIEQRPSFYWDTPVCLLCLHSGMLHALTRFYLVQNIGTDSGTHGNGNPKVIKFMQQNNRVHAVVPHTLPDVILDDKVCVAIQRYIKNIRHLSPSFRTIAMKQFKHITKHILRRFGIDIRRFPHTNEKSAAKYRPEPSQYSTIVGKGSIVASQIEAYFLALNKYVPESGAVLDVGFGLGYGLNILAIKSAVVSGVDVDKKVYDYCQGTVVGRNPRLKDLKVYDGYHLDYPDQSFDVVTCVDVLEHVERYDDFLEELLRVSRRGVFISTPNRRPEYTNPDGTPKNYWHLREWSFEELDIILKKHGAVSWNFLNGPYDGPFTWGNETCSDTIALSPFVHKTKVSLD